MRTSAEIISAARGCIGARFRPQGRNPGFGLDCVGVAAIAFDRAAPGDYSLRGGAAEAIRRAIDATGLSPIMVGQADAGDLLLVAAAADQFHLAILSDRGFIHADARLRRVVETPGRPHGSIVAAWRESE